MSTFDRPRPRPRRAPDDRELPDDAMDDGVDDIAGADDPAARDAPPDRLSSVSGLMASVSTAYTAAHGHPLEHDGLVSRQVRRRRWSVGIRTAVIGSLAVALVTGVVVVRDLARASGTPVPLAQVDPAAGEGTGTGPGGADEDSSDQDSSGGTLPSAVAPPEPAPPTAGPVTLAVHVVGQVNSPGVVQVAAGSRVIDAITAAGGLTSGADSGAVNLARPVVDGEQVYVPAPGEQVPVVAGSPATQPPPGDGPGSPAAPGGAPIDLNTADAAALDSLPGIGPALAGRIITWREANGGFGAIDDLLEVSGIGPAVLAKIRDLVAV